MDRNRYAIWWEALKNLFGLLLVVNTGDWFGLNNHIPGASLVIAGWFVLTTLITYWFVIRETEKKVPEIQI